MLLTVIIPCFNSAIYLRDAIDSVLSQAIKAEVIVQDGGSSDGTLEILESYGDRISYKSEADSGQSQALNRALKRATGDYIGWMNADDLYVEGAFSYLETYVDKFPEVDILYGDYTLIRGNGQTLRRYHVEPLNKKRLLSKGCYVWSGATFFRRSALIALGGFDESLHYCMDLDVFLRSFDSMTSVSIPHVLGSFRLHSSSKSGGVPWHFVREGHLVASRHADVSLDDRLRVVKQDLEKTLYLLTRSVWTSNLWSKIRREKRI